MKFLICSGVFFPVLQQYVIFPSPHYFQKVFLERSYFSYLGRGKSNIFKSIWTKHIAIWPYNILNTSKACVDVSAKFPKNTSENVVLINLTHYGFSTQWFSQIVFCSWEYFHPFVSSPVFKRCKTYTVQNVKLCVKDFFSKCDQIRKKLQIWSHLLKKSLMETSFFCVVQDKNDGYSKHSNDRALIAATST